MKKPIGRPRKPEGDTAITKALRFPRNLWKELEESVPKGKRSAVIHEGLRRELARLRKKS